MNKKIKRRPQLLSDDPVEVKLAACMKQDAVMMTIFDAVLVPIQMGARPMAHVQLPRDIARAIWDELEGALQEIGVYCAIGNVYTFEDSIIDLILYKDSEVFGQYVDGWRKWIAGSVSSGELCAIHGKLFGYSQEAIEMYIKEDELYPNDALSEQLVARGIHLRLQLVTNERWVDLT